MATQRARKAATPGRLCRRIASLAILPALLLSHTDHAARAQQSAPTLSPIERRLMSYLPAPETTPSGLSSEGILPLGNPLVAAEAIDPAEVHKILDRARIDGVSEDLRPSGAIGSPVSVDVSLFRDAAGAGADAADPVVGASQARAPALAPTLGDGSAAFFTQGLRRDTAMIAFHVDRLEVIVVESGPTGGISVDDVTPFAQRLAGDVSTPPAPSADELDVLQAQSSPESILHNAYELLLANYLSALSPTTLLTNAYAGASSALARAGISGLPSAPVLSPSDSESEWAQFLPAYQQLESIAADAVSAHSLAYAAAGGIYGHLNCHTTFLSPPVYRNELAALQGAERARSGISWIQLADGTEVIARIEPNSPADTAGLRPGDALTAVDGRPLNEQGGLADPSVSYDPRTALTLTIQRPGQPQPFDVSLTLQTIPPLIEQDRILAGGAGYVELDAFTTGDGAVDGVSQALARFQADVGVTGWILDLRYNDGGSESTLERIAGLFVGPGSLIVTDKQRDGTVSTGRSAGSAAPGQKPLVILTSSATASAAELLAQSLKDLGRATVVGETTAGCVNGGIPAALLDGSGVFISTVEVRAGPNKVGLENAGVTPDVPVSESRADLAAGVDRPLATAIATATGAAAP